MLGYVPRELTHRFQHDTTFAHVYGIGVAADAGLYGAQVRLCELGCWAKCTLKIFRSNNISLRWGCPSAEGALTRMSALCLLHMLFSKPHFQAT